MADSLVRRGNDIVQITSDPISVDESVDRVSSSGCGATTVFIGTTRDIYDGRKVIRLEYEAYIPMAMRQLLSLCDAAHAEWPNLAKVNVSHRTGLVPVTEASVIISVSSPHRRDSLEAVSFLIDRLKKDVAIWKKEIYEDGETNWKENTECPWRLGCQST